MRKMYDRGFYGGKFLPFHNGHRYCIRVAASECRELVVILFSNSEEETEIMSSETMLDKKLLSEESRIDAIREECRKYDNVRFAVLDCSVMHRQAVIDGTDLWDSETEYVIREVGDFQAVYSSEPGYSEYFSRAYPFAEHRLIDPPRVNVPISGTAVRKMNAEEAEKWIKEK